MFDRITILIPISLCHVVSHHTRHYAIAHNHAARNPWHLLSVPACKPRGFDLVWFQYDLQIQICFFKFPNHKASYKRPNRHPGREFNHRYETTTPFKTKQNQRKKLIKGRIYIFTLCKLYFLPCYTQLDKWWYLQ